MLAIKTFAQSNVNSKIESFLSIAENEGGWESAISSIIGYSVGYSTQFILHIVGFIFSLLILTTIFTREIAISSFKKLTLFVVEVVQRLEEGESLKSQLINKLSLWLEIENNNPLTDLDFLIED